MPKITMIHDDTDLDYLSAKVTVEVETDPDETETLDKLVQAFHRFLWAAGYTYVDIVTVTKEGGGEVNTL